MLVILKLEDLAAVVNRCLDVHLIIKLLYASEVRNELNPVVDVSRISLKELWDRQIGHERWLALLSTIVKRVI